MKLYRFSPVKNKGEIIEIVKHLHISCSQLCKNSLNVYLPVAGNVGIFCHYDEEYITLNKFKEELTVSSNNPHQKYFILREPIIIPMNEDIPEGTYTHLYIRKPDIYRSQVGDIDFVLEKEKYNELKTFLKNGGYIKGVRIFERPDLDMVELYNPDIDALGYVSPREMTEKVRVRQCSDKKV